MARFWENGHGMGWNMVKGRQVHLESAHNPLYTSTLSVTLMTDTVSYNVRSKSTNYQKLQLPIDVCLLSKLSLC